VWWKRKGPLKIVGNTHAYEAFGGFGLVLLKAVAITALTGLLLRVRRPGMGMALPAACTLLTLLTMSPRLVMQPACVSLVLFGISFYLLWRPRASDLLPPAPATFGERLRQHGPLLLVFTLWANLDEWFFLGPVLLLLFWAGERLDSLGVRQTPGWLVPAALAACLLNPHFYRVFTSLPPEIAPGVWTSELHEDVRFRNWFQSAWHRDYFQPSAGLTAAGLAYFALVALGLASFALRRRNLVGWRLLIWGVFALLSAWQVRTVGFFAVVAGPITALNLQDAAAVLSRDAVLRPRWRQLIRWGHGLLLVLGVALSILAWPGWLAAVPHEHHRVAWKVQADPSLQRIAETLHDWRQKGLLANEERVFPLHPEVANYCAWFARGEKGFLDLHSPGFSRLVLQYEAVCRAIASSRSGLEAPDEWRMILRDYGICVVVLYDAEDQRLITALHKLAARTEEWDLLRVDGRALVFGWKGGRPGDSFGRLRLDPQRLAFGPVYGDSALPPAPALGPQRAPRQREWWESFLTEAPAPSWQSDAARMYLRYSSDRVTVEQRHAVAGYVAAMIGVATPEPAIAADQILLRLTVAEPFIPSFATRGADLPLLAVRAARLALAANPDDKNAWLCLGQSYHTLHRTTDERSTSGHFALLDLLRHVQIGTALEHALMLDPDLEPAHEGLSRLYGERMFLDAALDHGRHALRLTRRGPRWGETVKDFSERLKAEEAAVNRLEQVVQDHKNEYAIRSRPMSGDPLGRAKLALSLGLAQLALDEVLLKSPVQAFMGEGARLELELLLQFGRAEGVREMLDDPEMRESKSKLEFCRVPAPARPGYLPMYRLPAFEWLRFLQTAASGDYALAAEAFHDLVSPLADISQRGRNQARSALPIVLATELGLAAEPRLKFQRIVVQGERRDLTRYLTEVSFLSKQRADLYVLAGLLATERGSPVVARQSFDAAFTAAAEGDPDGNFVAAPLAAAYRRRLEAFRAGTAEK
jgi:hypothetical protein